MKDLMKLGVFLMGISSIVVAVLGVLVYTKAVKSEKSSPFWVRCGVSKDGPAIIVHADRDVSNVEVVYKGTTLFEKESISAGSEEVFWVEDFATYEVTAMVDGKSVSKAITCIPPVKPGGFQ